MGIMIQGDIMIDNQKLLNQIMKAAQMGQDGIHAVMSRASQPALRQALKCQRKEYVSIEQEAVNLARKQGYHMKSLHPAVRSMAAVSARSRLIYGDANSKIAGMMIQGNTRGMIESLQNIRKCPKTDPAVAELAQKMLETEISNIRQMEGFL